MERICYDISLYWYKDHQDDPVLVSSLAHLLDSVEIYGTLREFAPAFTATSLEILRQGKSPSSLTRSLPMSLARSAPKIRSEYQETISNSPQRATRVKQFIPRKIRLQAKLEKSPERFFADSKKHYIRIAGQLCFSSALRPYCGNILIFATRKLLKLLPN